MKEIAAETRFDAATMGRGWHWHARTQSVAWIAVAFLGMLFLAFGIYAQMHLGGRRFGPLGLILAGLYFLARYWIASWQFSRALKKNPLFGATLRWIFSEAGVELQSAKVYFKGDWSVYLKTFTTPDGFLLYPQKGAFNWIPRSAFSSAEDAAELQDILTRKTPHKKLGRV